LQKVRRKSTVLVGILKISATRWGDTIPPQGGKTTGYVKKDVNPGMGNVQTTRERVGPCRLVAAGVIRGNKRRDIRNKTGDYSEIVRPARKTAQNAQE